MLIINIATAMEMLSTMRMSKMAVGSGMIIIPMTPTTRPARKMSEYFRAISPRSPRESISKKRFT